MRTQGYLAITCDGCGRAEKIALADAPVNAWNQPPPDGWWNGTDKMSWVLQDPFGQRVNDFCPECIELPLPVLIERIIKRSEEMAHANGT